MRSERAAFQVEQIDDVLIIEPTWQACDPDSDRCDLEANRIWMTLKTQGIATVVVDFQHIHHFRKYLLVHLLRWWSGVGHRPGKMRLCNVPDVGLEALRCLRFDRLWEIHSSRPEALQSLRPASS